jgi:hypothetical protein
MAVSHRSSQLRAVIEDAAGVQLFVVFAVRHDLDLGGLGGLVLVELVFWLGHDSLPVAGFAGSSRPMSGMKFRHEQCHQQSEVNP